MRSAPRSASAAYALPRKWAITRSRTSPAMRLRKIPAATRDACRPTPAWDAGADGPSGLADVVTIVYAPFFRSMAFALCGVLRSDVWPVLFINENTALARANILSANARDLYYTGLITT